MESPIRIDHLSHSSVALYSDCSRAWRGKYVDGLSTVVTPPLVIGSVFDRTVERYLRARTLGEPTPGLLQLWEQHWLEETTGERGARINWRGELPEQLQNDGARLVASQTVQRLLDGLRVLVDHDGQPALQQHVTLRIPGVSVPVIGYLDLIEADGIPGDFKTAARAWPADKTRKELQPRIYLAALLQAGYRPPGGRLLFRHYVFTKTKTPQVQALETQYSLGEVLFAVQVVQEAWKGISAGVFTPNTHSWLCSENTCQVWSNCVGRK